MPIKKKGGFLKYSKTGLFKKKKDTITKTLQCNCLEKHSWKLKTKWAQDFKRLNVHCTSNWCVGEGIFPAHLFGNLSWWEEVPWHHGQTLRTICCCLHTFGGIKKNNLPLQENKDWFRNFPLTVRKICCLKAAHLSCHILDWKKDQDLVEILGICVCISFPSCSLVKKTE